MKCLFSKPIVVISTMLWSLSLLPAQTFSVLHHFGGFPEGRSPQASLVAAGNSFFSVADSGGTGHSGAVYKINKDGSGYAKLHDFPLLLNETNSQGAYPDSTPILSGNTLYGAAYDGGISGSGTVFKINTNGTGFTVLHHFAATALNHLGAYTNAQGAHPESGLVVADNFVFGTTEGGGTSGLGTVFRVGTNGTGFTNLHSFTSAEGGVPEALVLVGNQLYGTAAGLSTGVGSVFRLNTNGTGFTILHSFVATNYVPPQEGPGPEPAYTNIDGALPASLLASGTTLYGTTYWGGANGNGTVFRMQLDGSGFSVLHSFAASATNQSGLYTNNGGAHPIQFAGLTLAGNTLYGTTYLGGTNGNGTVFALTTNGSDFAVLHHFSATSGVNETNIDGANPYAGLIQSEGTLFGTAVAGGLTGNGTIFSITTAPRLNITRANSSVILTWPTTAVGFALESNTNLAAPLGWAAVTPVPTLVNGLKTVTNTVTATPKFYRLKR
jgi:uncharacterized repeat protein (TIGR03803 family)